MIDPFFDTRQPIIKVKSDEMEQQVQHQLSQLPTTTYLKGIVSWSRKILRKRLVILGKLPVDLSPVSFLPTSNNQLELRNAFDHVASGKTSESELWNMVASRLIGRGLAIAISTRPTLSNFDRVAKLLDIVNHEVWIEFLSAIQKSKEKNEWIQLLRTTRPKLENFSEQRGYSIEELRSQQINEKSANNADLFMLWDYRWRPFYIPLELRARLSALFKFDVKAFVEIVEQLPLAGIMMEAIEESWISRNQNALLSVIKAASHAYNSRGVWTRGVLAVFLPQLALDYGIELNRALEYSARQTSSLSAPHTETQSIAVSEPNVQSLIKKLFIQFYGAILHRSDGQILLKNFSVYLVKSQANVQNISDPKNVHWIALNVIQELLISMNPKWSREILFEKTSGITSNHRRINAYYPFLTFCLFDSTAVKEQWSWYCRLLENRDEDLIQHLNQFGTQAEWHFHVVGRVLASFPNPIQIFESIWDKLYDQRFEGRFQVNHDMHGSSLHILKAARCALGWMVEQKASIDAQLLWKKIFQLEIKLHFESRLSTPSMARELILLFAYVPRVFNDWKIAFQEASEFLKLDPVLAAGIAVILKKNMVPVNELDEGFDGLSKLKDLALHILSLGLDERSKVFSEEDLAVAFTQTK